MPATHGGRYVIRDGKRERVTGEGPVAKSTPGPKAEKPEKQEKRNG